MTPEVLGPRNEDALRQGNYIERQARKVFLEWFLNPRVIDHHDLFKLGNPCLAQARQQREHLSVTLMRGNDNRDRPGHYRAQLRRAGSRDNRRLEGTRVTSGMSWT